MSTVADIVEGTVRKEFGRRKGQEAPQFGADTEWRKVVDAGPELWLDTDDMGSMDSGIHRTDNQQHASE